MVKENKQKRDTERELLKSGSKSRNFNLEDEKSSEKKSRKGSQKSIQTEVRRQLFPNSDEQED